MKPLISVIIPVYNQEKYLTRCLDSILDQTFQSFKIICVNDGSTDSSPLILENYAKTDKRIKIVSQKNTGLSMARNKGLEYVNTPYVCFLDSDDSLDKTFLMDLYNEARKTNADIIMTGTRYIRKKKKEDNFKNKILFKFKDKIDILPYGACWNKLYKTDFIKKYNLSFPKGLYWEDNPFTVKACYYSNKLAVINGGKYNYINNPKSITHDSSKEIKRLKDSNCILQLILNFINEQKCTDDEKKSVLKFCLRSFVIDKDQDCFKDFFKNIKCIVKMKLFGIIPIGQFIQKGNQKKTIFKYLPFIKTKIKIFEN